MEEFLENQKKKSETLEGKIFGSGSHGAQPISSPLCPF